MPLIRKDPGQSPPPRAVPDDATALLQGASAERWEAARRLADTPGGAEALVQALPRETDPRVRQAILTSLVRIGTEPSIQAMLPLLRSDDAALRTDALDALRSAPRAAAAHLPALLADPDPDVRLLACELARGLPGDQGSRLLGELLARETQVNVCAAAIDVMAEIAGPDSLPVLAACGARFASDPFLQFAITLASERISSQKPDADD